jgi:hypothetical protein
MSQIIESDLCGAMNNNGRGYCKNRTRHPSGFCPSHRRNAEGKCPPLRKKKIIHPEFFTRAFSSRTLTSEETPIRSKEVTLRFGDAELSLSWNHGIKAFEIRTMHKGLRDGMTLIPDCSNRIFIKAGER